MSAPPANVQRIARFAARLVSAHLSRPARRRYAAAKDRESRPPNERVGGQSMQLRTWIALALCLSAPLAAPPLLAGEARKLDQGRNLGTGIASYYGNEFSGRRTANGETYRSTGLTAAHRTAPFGSRIKVRNLDNGRAVVVRINDRGPWTRGRIIDLSFAAAKAIGLHRSGTARVSLTMVSD
ncbi:septal ring lytic transglycosylase RlpA family protein [Novosphingobium sp.]|uniref:septal ring lytic transglycosylase RlpA family protein n=1 Tax=Novosphingobium sp. TaxID=1874826 RepID=UPI00286C1796|nr:septal ring lytic transglycosylase RlpA family protein [Novosphingobium sp.]